MYQITHAPYKLIHVESLVVEKRCQAVLSNVIYCTTEKIKLFLIDQNTIQQMKMKILLFSYDISFVVLKYVQI